MMPCLHYGCNFRNENGFCKVTTCANPDYNGLMIRVANTIKVAPKTNADRIRNMTDEELAKFIERTMFMVYESVAKVCRMVGYAGQWDSEGIIREELDWLKQEVDS